RTAANGVLISEATGEAQITVTYHGDRFTGRWVAQGPLADTRLGVARFSGRRAGAVCALGDGPPSHPFPCDSERVMAFLSVQFGPGEEVVAFSAQSASMLAATAPPTAPPTQAPPRVAAAQATPPPTRAAPAPVAPPPAQPQAQPGVSDLRPALEQ